MYARYDRRGEATESAQRRPPMHVLSRAHIKRRMSCGGYPTYDSRSATELNHATSFVSCTYRRLEYGSATSHTCGSWIVVTDQLGRALCCTFALHPSPKKRQQPHTTHTPSSPNAGASFGFATTAASAAALPSVALRNAALLLPPPASAELLSESMLTVLEPHTECNDQRQSQNRQSQNRRLLTSLEILSRSSRRQMN